MYLAICQMARYYLSGLHIPDATYQFATRGEQTITHAVDTFRRTTLEALLQHLNAVLTNQQLALGGLL